jgi:hypothetical protein
MTKIDRLEPVFVEFVPKESDLQPGKLYISMEYNTTVHLCASGCGIKVVLPLNPAKWHLKFDGESVSLSPSVGNWDYPCESHYWIRNNRIDWAPRWDRARIEAGRRTDERDLDEYFERFTDEVAEPKSQHKPSILRSLWRRLRGLK